MSPCKSFHIISFKLLFVIIITDLQLSYYLVFLYKNAINVHAFMFFRKGCVWMEVKQEIKAFTVSNVCAV